MLVVGWGAEPKIESNGVHGPARAAYEQVCV
jgi:hypothetical protein